MASRKAPGMDMDGAASTTGGGRNNGVQPRPTYVLWVGLPLGENTKLCGLGKLKPPVVRRLAFTQSGRSGVTGHEH